MTGYPVLLHVEGRQVVVAGGGEVAARKTADLLESGAQITIISPALNEPLSALATRGAVRWVNRPYAPGALTGLEPFMVFAATDSPAVNAQVIVEAQALGALVGAADDTPGGNFTSMASVRRGRVTLAVATDGASPALAVHLRRRLETVIGDEYGTLVEWLAELRPLVRQHLKSSDARRALWQAIIASPALEHLRQGDEASARRVIQRLLLEAGVEVRER